MNRRPAASSIRPAGTSIPGALAVRNNDDANVANTSVTMINGPCSPCANPVRRSKWTRFAADAGPVTWRPDLAALPFSAHPLADHDGSLWNFGSISLMGAMACWSGTSVRTASCAAPM